MLETFKAMMKEEWRLHSCIFGSLMFALLPFLICAASFFLFLLFPIFSSATPNERMLAFLQYAFMMSGVSVGAFGLLSREIMNRRFGSASLVAYSSRSLPVSERFILLNFFAKDIIYYFFLWIAPFVLGFSIACPFISSSAAYSLYLLLALSLSFLKGLSASFFLSTLYAHSSKLLVVFLAVSAIIASYFLLALKASPDFLIFSYPSTKAQLLSSLAFIVVFSSLSLIFPKIDFPQSKKQHKNSLKIFSEKLGFEHSILVAKDFLDIGRSEGGMGKIILSFLLPALILWMMASTFVKFVPGVNILVLFAMLLGVLSTSFYNWFTEYDSFNFYAFLPIKVSDIIKGKIKSFALACIASIIALALAAVLSNQTKFFGLAAVSFIATAFYATSITAYLAGLNPNLLLYNAGILSKYMLYLSPMLILSIFLSSALIPYFAFNVLLFALSFFVLKKSYKKWDEKVQIVF